MQAALESLMPKPPVVLINPSVRLAAYVLLLSTSLGHAQSLIHGAIPTTPALGKPGELRATKVFRLTPPGASEYGFGLREMFSADMKRVLFHHSGSIVWAFVDDLKSWTTTTQFQAARKLLPSSFANFPEWSPFPGETNVVYAANKSTRTIVRYNLDTGAQTTVVSYDPGGRTTVNPWIKGWTTDLKLVVTVNQEEYGDGLYEIDVIAKTRKFYSGTAYPTGQLQRWPNMGHGHSCTNPKGTLQASMSAMTLFNWVTGAVIKKMPNNYYAPNYRAMTHCSWKTNADWWVSDDVGINWYKGALNNSLPTAPHIDSYALHQCWTDGVCKLLYTQTSAGSRRMSNGSTEWNYQSTMINTLSRDGRKVLFTTTEGKFSVKDNKDYGSTPFQSEALYLVELEPVVPAPPGTKPPPPQPNPPIEFQVK